MPHQFLHNLELRTSGAEQRRVCPSEGVPPNPLGDAQLARPCECDDEEAVVPNTGSFPDSEGWRTPNSPAFDRVFCGASSADHGSDDHGGARVFAKPLSCTFRRPVARSIE